MDHNRVAEIHAIERYLLGELPPGERDDFEEHYFSCAECAAEVRAAAQFRANAREVLRDPGQLATGQFSTGPERVRRFSWWRFPVLAPLAASLMLLGVVAYQNTVTIPGLRAPRVLSAALILDGRTRGSLPHLEDGQPVNLLMALDPASAAQNVIAELEGASAKVTGPAQPAPGHDQPLNVYFPGAFPPGRYTAIVRDAQSGRELARNEFEIIPKEKKSE